MREADRERQKREWEMKERQAEEQRTREEELRRRQQEEMAIRIRRQEEELHRRQQENNLFMQVRWVIKFKMFAILYFFFNSIFRLSCTYNCIVLYSRNRQFAVVAKVMILSVATIVMVMVNLMVSNEFLFQKDRKMRLRRDIATHSCIVHICTSSKPYD